MEGTAVSLGKAVLDGALAYAKSVLADEVALQLGVERNVSFITDELEMMQSFLMAADEEHEKHKVLLTWVKQVREVAYNVEDGLMDFSARSSSVRCLWFNPRALWVRRGIAKEIQELKAKVEDVSNRNLRYRLIKGSGSKAIATSEEQARIASAAMFGINEAMRTAVEQENPKVDLCQLINNGDEDLRVITLWGEHVHDDDIGMISAIQRVYDNSTANANFGFRAWVTLMHPLDPTELIWSLVRQFYENFPEKLEETYKRNTIGSSVYMKMKSMTQREITDVFDRQVSEDSYLIVIDDLSTITEWDCIRKYFPNNKKGSRIIVYTLQFKIANMCAEKPYQISELKQQSSHPTLYLFHKKVVHTSVSIPVLYTSEDNSAIPNNEIEEGEQQPKHAGADKASDDSTATKFDRSKTMALVDEVLVGRKTEKTKLIDSVGQPDKSRGLKVISVWGMGGIGKTTLVQSVYRSPQLGGWKRAWATALRPFNPDQLIRRLAIDLLGPSKETADMKLKELSDMLKKFLKEEMCLLVLDDISSTTEWDLVINCLENATRIIVTTREKSIAKHCSKEDENLYNLSAVEEDVAFDLFKKKVSKDGVEKIEFSPDMMEQATQIIKKCDGLPLAISTIGGFLATKPKTATEWKKTNDRISAELEISPELRTIKTVLVRSYDGLPYHLKSCFLYLSIFPEDHKISRKRLIRRWVAEGYAREMHGLSAEEIGDKYFEDLLDRSMILPGEDVNIYSGKIKYCQLHDIMRQICISKAREENISFTLEEGCSLSNTQGAVRHLAVMSRNWNIDKQDVFERIGDLSHVRSLTTFGDCESFFISKRLRFLRVMDLEGTHGIEEVHHLNQIGELIHLKFLSLRGCVGFTHLPNSLGNLSNLQALDLRRTRVTELPPTVTNLRKLQFLRGEFFVVPRGTGKLNALCTLDKVHHVHTKGKGSIRELAKLYRLRKLGVENIRKTNSKEFWSAIDGLNHLRSLSINWQHRLTGIELDDPLGGSLLPPKNIESLKLCGGVVKLKEWIHQLQNLSRLILLLTELNQDAIQALGKLQNLTILYMWGYSFKGEELVFRKGSFPSLVLLELNNIPEVVSIKFEDGTMSKLEVLKIGRFLFKLQELSGLKYLPKLKEIRLQDLDSCGEFKDNVQEQLAEHLNNSNVIVIRS